MKRLLIITFSVGALLALLAPGVAVAAPKITPHGAPAASTIRYEFTSDTTLNDVTYFGRDGRLVVRKDVRFVPLPIGFSREKYGLTIQFRAGKHQPAGSQITSREQYASCTVKVNNRTVDYQRELFKGFANC